MEKTSQVRPCFLPRFRRTSGHGENKSGQALLFAKVPEDLWAQRKQVRSGLAFCRASRASLNRDKTSPVRLCFLPSLQRVSKHGQNKSGQALLFAKLPEGVWARRKQVRSGSAFCQASRGCLGTEKTSPVRPCFLPSFQRVSGHGENKSGQALPLLWAFMWCWRVSGLAKAAQHSLHWNPFSTCILACFHRSARDLVR